MQGVSRGLQTLYSVDIFDIVKRIENTSMKFLTLHVPTVHEMRSESRTVVQHSEEFINFLTELNAEFPGPQRVQVLSFVQDLIENSNTGQLETIIEEGKNQKVFEDIGVLRTYQSLKTETLKQAVSKIKGEGKEKIRKEKVIKELVAPEKVQKEKVRN